MNNIKVSILVPICNVERYLGKCLESLINQDLQEIEIICINDGSKDNSLGIIEKYAEKDSRIVIINKENSGYGDSMNRGLNIARGEYIGIVESDDFASANMFKELYEKAIEKNCDVVKSNFYLYWEKPEKIQYFNSLHIDQDIFGEGAREPLLYSSASIWSAIYKREYLVTNNICFLPTPGASYQDTSFNFKVGCTAKIIYLLKSPLLYYRQDNENSSVKNLSIEKALYLHKEWDEGLRYIKNKKMDKYYIDYCTLRLKGLYWNYDRLMESDKKTYFDKMHDDVISHGKNWKIKKEKLKRSQRYGQIHYIRTGNYKAFKLFYRLSHFR